MASQEGIAVSEPHVIKPEPLRHFCAAIFTAAGVPGEEAKLLGESLVAAECAGLASHGVSRVTDYLKRLEAGLVTPRTEIRIVRETPASALMDAGNGWGQVASEAAVALCIRKAREVGAAWVSVRNSNHYGTAAQWTERIARAGMIGISGTNGSPTMAPFGSLDESLGTNPISIAVPASSGAPIILDMATSAQARGKILVALKNGGSIPEGWAMTRDGRPTTDPKEAWEGIMLPAAGAKGSGLAMMVDILSGVVPNANFGADMPRMYGDAAPQALGHFFIALNIEAITPMAECMARMAVRESQTRNSRPAPGFTSVKMPGDVEHERAAMAEKDGVKVAAGVFNELVETAGRYGVEPSAYLVNA